MNIIHHPLQNPYGDKVSAWIKEIYDNGEIPENPGRSVFITLPEKPCEKEYKIYWTVRLISRIISILFGF